MENYVFCPDCVVCIFTHSNNETGDYNTPEIISVLEVHTELLVEDLCEQGIILRDLPEEIHRCQLHKDCVYSVEIKFMCDDDGERWCNFGEFRLV